MTEYSLALKAGAGAMWGHDPSAALFVDGELVFAAEEERFSRNKHAPNEFPEQAVVACLNHGGIEASDIDRLLLTADPELTKKRLPAMLEHELLSGDDRLLQRLYGLKNRLDNMLELRVIQPRRARGRLRRLGDGDESPEFSTVAHHRCHARSAFAPSGFEEALVVTLDGRGEYDSTVVWHGTSAGLDRIRTYEYPNSLGSFFAVVTSFLGYQPNNGEGKVMGLAPYGEPNQDIEDGLRELITTGVEYDTTALTTGPDHLGVERLEEQFDRERHDPADPFDQWERDFAYVAQSVLEETVTDLVERYARSLNTSAVCLAGGVALNCKLNKRVRESPVVDDMFVQPVAHDGGLALGAGLSETPTDDGWDGGMIFLGPEYSTDDICEMLNRNKIDYSQPEHLETTIAQELADGRLVGWFQGRSEIGPRALGHRSILADPRDEASRNRVNQYVKHREEWRPFAPSMLAEVADEYLIDPVSAPYMIQTFDVRPDKQDEIEAVLHPADQTTRPQTVTKSSNPRYYRLIEAFGEITGVPVVLNTSFNDHGEPIVNTPEEALVDFYRMGLDTLVLEDVVVRK